MHGWQPDGDCTSCADHSPVTIKPSAIVTQHAGWICRKTQNDKEHCTLALPSLCPTSNNKHVYLTWRKSVDFTFVDSLQSGRSGCVVRWCNYLKTKQKVLHLIGTCACTVHLQCIFNVHFQIPCMTHTGDCDHSPQFYLIVQHRNHQFHSGLCSSCMYESTDSWLLRFQQLNLFYKTLITSDLNISATVQWVLIVVACGGKHWADSCLLAVGAGAALLGFCMVQFFIACLNGTPLFQRLETYFC